MFKLNNVNKLFIVGLLILVVVCFALPDFLCNRDKNVLDRERKDAVMRAIDSVKVIFKPVTDSLNKVIDQKQERIEYWMKQRALAESSLTSSQASLESVTEKYYQAKARRDTIRMLDDCSDLAREAEVLSTKIGGYMYINHNLSKSNDSLIQVVKQKSAFSTSIAKMLMDSTVKLSILYDNLDAKYRKTLKKSNRQYTVGAGIGYGIGLNGKVQPYVGVTLTKTIFRF